MEIWKGFEEAPISGDDDYNLLAPAPTVFDFRSNPNGRTNERSSPVFLSLSRPVRQEVVTARWVLPLPSLF